MLAVGDARFQEKCLGKMKDVAGGGRTVIFVSHNMNAVLQLTSRAIVLSGGKLEFAGAPEDAVATYIQGHLASNTTEYDVRDAKRRYEGTGDAKILSLRFDHPVPNFEFLEPIRYILRIRAERSFEKLRASMTVFAGDGTPIGSSFSSEIGGMTAGEERGRCGHFAGRTVRARLLFLRRFDRTRRSPFWTHRLRRGDGHALFRSAARRERGRDDVSVAPGVGFAFIA